MTEQERTDRINLAMEYWANLPEDRLRAVMRETVLAIINAVDDPGAFPERLHPADIVTHHLQRGNLLKDGDW